MDDGSDKASLTAAERRLATLRERQKALQARIQITEAKLKEKDRRARTRRLIESGALVEIAQLGDQDKGTVLGGLLEVRKMLVNSDRAAALKRLGDALIARREAQRNASLRQPLSASITPVEP